MNSTARDVLTMIGVGLQRGIIRSPDLEMMYSDGPKRVRLIDMVAHALESLPAAPSSADAENIPEPPRAPLTPPSAHPALAATVDYTERVAAWERLTFGTRAYYAALAECDAAWERIASAVGVRVDAPTEREQTLAGLLKRCARCLPPDHATRKLATDYLKEQGFFNVLRTPGVAASDALDARRYRFLRDVARQDSNGGLRCVGNCADGGAPLHISGRDLDRAVDAASGVDTSRGGQHG